MYKRELIERQRNTIIANDISYLPAPIVYGGGYVFCISID
jgi:hypothetical protein